MSDPIMTTEDFGETISMMLDGSLGLTLKQSGWALTYLDCGEIYIRTNSGDVFRLLVEAVSPDDVEGWGISFEDVSA